jgi:type I restriction enzyme M protein
MNLADILKDSNYKLSQFTIAEIEQLEQTIILKSSKNGEVPYTICLVRKKEIKLTPEEVIRQLFLMVLTGRLGYPLSRIQVEYGVNFGREVKRADIVVMDKDRPNTVYMLVELKKPKLKDGKDQLRSYCNATGAPIAVWTNGDQISYYQRKDPNYFEDIPGLPNVSQTLADILNECVTLVDLIAKDKLVKENKSLKTLIEEMEDEVLANAGVDVFEELFKLIFTKLYDEWYSGQGNRRNKRCLEFRNTGQTEAELKTKIQDLFDKAKKKWEGVFSEDARITLTPSHLSVCVASLENVKLFNSNLDVIDEAFEYLINQSSKGDKGQYFTPRYVIDMCVKMLNPQEDEYMIDTAAGSSGFPVHTIFHVWRQILDDEGLEASHLFSLEDKPPRCTEYVEDKVFAIDFDEKAVRVARTLNLIAGDGQTNVLHLNTLDYELWDEITDQEEWDNIYNTGFKRLKRLRPKGSKNYREFQFDVLMANPPFAGDIKEPRMISSYDLAKKPDGKWQTKVGRDILFIERNLDFLKPGGRMAIVLPQGRFNNSSDKNIRDFIAERCRILAVVGLHGNTFKPHTGTKTSVLFVQKWNDDPKVGALCPRRDNYNIFFATMRKSGKDNSGEKMYRRIVHQEEEGLPEKEKERQFLLDPHDHLIVDHDLYNHERLTEDGIAEAFIEFAKKEQLSFFEPGPSVTPFDAMRYQQLMDGLEAIETLSHQIHESERIDSDFFKKEFVYVLDELSKVKIDPLQKLARISDGNHLTISEDFLSESSEGVRYLRGQDISQSMLLDNRNEVFIPESAYSDMERSHIFKDDILITIVGANTGFVAWVYNPPEKLTANCKLGIARPHRIGAGYLYTFLISGYGQKQIIRSKRGGGQTGLILPDMRELAIARFSQMFEDQIQEIADLAHNLFHIKNKQLYSEAEGLLLSELGLKDWQPTEETVAVKSFADSFLSSGRCDAEYYQPKYDEAYSLLNQFNSQPLDKIAVLKKGSQARSESEDGVPYASIKDINGFLIETNEKTNFIQENLVFAEPGSIALAITGATIGKVGMNATTLNIAVSGDLVVINPYSLPPEYILIVLYSPMIQFLCKRDTTGTTNGHLSVNDVAMFPIPSLDKDKVHLIASKVKEAILRREQSKQLLEIAKTGVERAIETNEATATTWINQQLKALDLSPLFKGGRGDPS